MGLIELDRILAEIEEKRSHEDPRFRIAGPQYSDGVILIAKCILHATEEIYRLRIGETEK
jgi:hypothetical protein